MTAEQPPSFTANPAANDLIVNDPFAFLLGVLFDQGIPAERAWQAPYGLARRLGHLDPRRICRDEAAVRAAISRRPALHRYVDKMPRWIAAAARRVVDEYDCDASKIWTAGSTARAVFKRLDAFEGIGQKKAAMAVEILQRDLGADLSAMEGSDIAYDVHVRRVFLRTGLAQRDDLQHMVQVARDAHPQRPGAIDFPAWLVGRGWCRAGTPACGACPIADACPKLVAAARKVRGA